MYHCPRRGRGIHVKNSKLKNILLRTDSTYSRMLEKCVGELYSNTADIEQYDFYIADSRSVAIWNSDDLEYDEEGGGTRKCSWTLSNYIKLSCVKFPSKVKFFCVKQEKGFYMFTNCIIKHFTSMFI